MLCIALYRRYQVLQFKQYLHFTQLLFHMYIYHVSVYSVLKVIPCSSYRWVQTLLSRFMKCRYGIRNIAFHSCFCKCLGWIFESVYNNLRRVCPCLELLIVGLKLHFNRTAFGNAIDAGNDREDIQLQVVTERNIQNQTDIHELRTTNDQLTSMLEDKEETIRQLNAQIQTEITEKDSALTR